MVHFWGLTINFLLKVLVSSYKIKNLVRSGPSKQNSWTDQFWFFLYDRECFVGVYGLLHRIYVMFWHDFVYCFALPCPCMHLPEKYSVCNPCVMCLRARILTLSYIWRVLGARHLYGYFLVASHRTILPWAVGKLFMYTYLII
jgi:hypothetical protein